ncbi:MAG: TOBE domain-containing protein, partial [Solirubrobacteraceae bacterium]
DQEEAMVMSDRLAVMNRGKIEQLGSPEDVYERPSTAFVASFLGASNLIAGDVIDRGGPGYARVALAGAGEVLVGAERLPEGREHVRIGVRPEKLSLEPVTAPAQAGMNSVTGRVTLASYLGVSHQYAVEGPGGSTVTVYVQNLGASHPPTLGETVRLVWRPEHTFVV